MHSPTCRFVRWRATASTAGLMACATVGGLGRPAVAQTARVTGSLDVAASVVTYDDYLRSGAVSVVPAVRWETARATLVARGAASRFESGRGALQATIAGSAFTPEVWKLRAEVFGAMAGARYSDTVSATSLYGLGRLHAASPDGGAWVGAGRGFVSQGTRLFNDVVQFDVGAWRRWQDGLYTLTWTPTRVGALRFQDVVAAGRWQWTRGELSTSAGARLGRDVRAVRGASRWGEVQGTWWLRERLAFVGGVGVFPLDVIQGLPGGRYLSTALRIGARRPLTSDPALRAELTLPYELERLRRNARPGDLQVLATPEGLRRIRVTVRGARSVELMADFTDWTPTALAEREPGVWELDRFISPGVHRVNVRIDGGEWIVPPGLSAARDEFGGAVGLLVVQ